MEIFNSVFSNGSSNHKIKLETIRILHPTHTQQQTAGIKSPSFDDILKHENTQLSVTSSRSPYTVGRYEALMREMKESPQRAEELTRQYAHQSLEFLLLDASSDPMRIASTGEIYTEGLQARYHQMWQQLQPGRVALYEAEVAKGTSAIDIMEKLWEYNDALPLEFRRIAGW